MEVKAEALDTKFNVWKMYLKVGNCKGYHVNMKIGFTFFKDFYGHLDGEKNQVWFFHIK